MLRVLLIVATFLAATSPAFAAGCNGVDLSVGPITVQNVTTSGNLNQYHISGTVTNIGSAAQPSDALTAIDIFGNGARLDTRGIPPLKAGGSYTFGYVYQRSTDAGKDTSHLRFELVRKNSSAADGAGCSPANDTFTLTF
jgi:hypothetical protein